MNMLKKNSRYRNKKYNTIQYNTIQYNTIQYNTFFYLIALVFASLLAKPNAAQAQYKNFAPQQQMYDSIYGKLIRQVLPAYNLLFDKALITSGLAYCDGDINTDTLRYDNVLEQYTEVINMDTRGQYGYGQVCTCCR
jgi:hypothetical protein